MLSVKSLCMLAGVLSSNYGVEVKFGGQGAFTSRGANGEMVINIPGIESDDADYLTLVRGYIDHEVGHVRFTDWNLQPKDGIEAQFANIFEDYFVESKMGELYTGCKQNLVKLSKLLFDAPVVGTGTPLGDVFQYILLGVRAHLTSCLSERQREFLPMAERALGADTRERLDKLIAKTPKVCTSTAGCTRLASEVMQLLRETADQEMNDQLDGKNSTVNEIIKDMGVGQQAQGAIQSTTADTPSRSVSQSLDSYEMGKGAASNDHVSSTITPTYLEAEDIKEAKKVSSALDIQLRSLLQSWVRNRGGASRWGRLDTRLAYRLAVSDCRIFQRNEERRGVDTEVVILADSSGSMMGKRAKITSCAVYGLAKSLTHIAGVKTSVAYFNSREIEVVLRRGQQVHARMKIGAAGGTLAGAAMLQALHLFSNEDGKRRVFILMTDGETHDAPVLRQAIDLYDRLGINIVGIGLESKALLTMLDESRCTVINQIQQLCPALFRIMRQQLVAGGV